MSTNTTKLLEASLTLDDYRSLLERSLFINGVNICFSILLCDRAPFIPSLLSHLSNISCPCVNLISPNFVFRRSIGQLSKFSPEQRHFVMTLSSTFMFNLGNINFIFNYFHLENLVNAIQRI